MDINTEITHNSWGDLAGDKAKDYLQYQVNLKC